MPHCTIEYSDNCVDTVDFAHLFGELHAALVEFETFPLGDIKSRAVRHAVYTVGDGSPHNAFVHLTFNLLSGRDISVRQRIVQACMRVLAQYFAASIATLRCQVTVELREMERSTYAKYEKPAATL